MLLRFLAVTTAVTAQCGHPSPESYCMAKHLIPGDKTLQGIKPGDPRKRISDGGGLYLLLAVKGGAHGWRFDYTV